MNHIKLFESFYTKEMHHDLRKDRDVSDILNIARDEGIICNIQYSDKLFPEFAFVKKDIQHETFIKVVLDVINRLIGLDIFEYYRTTYGEWVNVEDFDITDYIRFERDVARIEFWRTGSPESWGEKLYKD